jgi:DNA-binding beta-propeller fold protein YncE
MAAVGHPPIEQPPEAPVSGPDGQVVIGRQGGVRGQFVAPAGMAVDAEGNVYVADSGNHRIQKFDSALNFLGAFGSAGGGDGQFNEPWSVAVDAEGNIYVADTWNHRIQKFDSSFQFVKAWGAVLGGWSAERPLEPRTAGIAIDRRAIVVVDTGNTRLRFTSRETLASWRAGSVSQFDEPAGSPFPPGRSGGRPWNRRIQRFSPG